MGVGYVLFLHTTLFVDVTMGNSTSTTQSSGEVSDISKAFISLGVLAAAFIISFIVAKVVDYCYDRASLRDDASDISEHTRQLIKARIALSRFKTPLKNKKKKKKKSEKESKKNAKVFFNLWSQNAKKKGLKRPKSDVIINVEEAKNTDQLQVNGSVKKPPHVTFIDEVNTSGKIDHETVLSIAVPSLKSAEAAGDTSLLPQTAQTSAKTKDNMKIPTISAKVAEKESSGNASSKDSSKKTPTQTETPRTVKGKGSPSIHGRATPAGETRRTANGRATPVIPRAGSGTATAGVRSTPIMPRAGTATSRSKTVTVKSAATLSRPTTAPSPKVGTKVSYRAASAKTPSTPKLNSKPSQGSQPKPS